jgi:hypothetical protein
MAPPGGRTVRQRTRQPGAGSLLGYLKLPLVRIGLAISLAVAGIIALDAVLDDDWAQKAVKRKAEYNAK